MNIVGAILFVVNWLIIIWALLYIPRDRKPVAAMAWILAISLIPIPGIILFFIIGSPKLSRTRRAMQRTIDGLIGTATKTAADVPLGLSELDFQRYMPLIKQNQSLGKMPALRGNKVKVLPGYEEILHDMIKRIKHAKEYVYLEFYAVALDDTTKPFFGALEAAVKRGVEVYMLFDSLGTHKYHSYHQMTRELTRIGVTWHKLLPISLIPRQYNRPDLRNHRKIVVVDGEVGYIGSINLIESTYQRHDDIRYEELVVRVKGPVVSQCGAIFAADWFSETGVALEKFARPVEVVVKEKGVLAQLLPSGPSYDHDNNLQLFVSLLYAAKRRVVITNPYFVPDEALLVAVIAAIKRGVTVSIINSAAIDQWMVGHAQRSYYAQLLKEGVHIYLHNEPVLLHAKHVTIDDDIAVVGSSNMDMRSFQLDQETVIVLYDKGVVADLVKVQQRNMNDSTKIEPGDWKRRGFLHEALESIARLTSSVQ